MKTTEAQAIEYDVSTQERKCTLMERFVMLFIVSLSMSFLLAIVWEVRVSMHLRNAIVHEELFLEKTMGHRYPNLNPTIPAFMP